MKIYLIKGFGVNIAENAIDPVAIICQTPEEVEQQIGFIMDEAQEWARFGWGFPLEYLESVNRRRGMLTGYGMTIEYDIRDPEQKQNWLESPALGFAGISPDDFNYSEKSCKQHDRNGIKHITIAAVSVREINLSEQ